MTEHDVIYAQSSEPPFLWRWDCEDCQWTGLSCPSLDFAKREHASTAKWLSEPSESRR